MIKIKALSVHQPWATLIVDDEPEVRKSVEVRSWKTSYRGPLLICAGKTLDETTDEKFNKYARNNPNVFPLGVAVGVVTLDDCVPLDLSMAEEAYWNPEDDPTGMYAWLLSSPTWFKNDFPVRGMPGLMDVELPPSAIGELQGTPYADER